MTSKCFARMVRMLGTIKKSNLCLKLLVNQIHWLIPINYESSLTNLLQVAGAAGRIARADVARFTFVIIIVIVVVIFRFMLSSLSSDENIKKGVAIAV